VQSNGASAKGNFTRNGVNVALPHRTVGDENLQIYSSDRKGGDKFLPVVSLIRWNLQK
jgi:hypothetical protein